MDVSNFNIKCADYIREVSSLVVQEKYGLHCDTVQFCDMASYYKNIVNPPLSIDPADSLPTIHTKKIIRFSDHICQTIEIFPPMVYGILYKGYAVKDGRGITSAGWHIPTSVEMQNIITAFGTDRHTYQSNNPEAWLSTAGVTNSLKFNAAGVGGRDVGSGNFISYGNSFIMWCSDYVDGWDKIVRIETSIDDLIRVSISYLGNGFSVRPMKDSTTLNHGETGTYTGNDGKVYPTICIDCGSGNKYEIVSENIRETQYRNGNLITLRNSLVLWRWYYSEAMCYYNDDTNNI